MCPGDAYFLINDGAKGCYNGAGDGQQQHHHARGGGQLAGVEVAAEAADDGEGSDADIGLPGFTRGRVRNPPCGLGSIRAVA